MTLPTTNLILHLEAEDLAASLADGAAVALWEDRTANGNDFDQNNDANRPHFHENVVNGLGVVRFTSDNADTLNGPDLFNGAAAGEIFAIVKIDNDPPGNGIHTGLWTFGASDFAGHFPFTDGTIYESFGTNVRKTVGNPTPALTDWRLYNVASAAGAYNVRLDDTSIFSTATNTVAWRAGSYLGWGDLGAYWLDGDLAAVIAYDAVLSTEDRAAVVAYLADRYNVPALPPAQVSGVAAASLTETSIRVTWSDLGNETGYRVERSDNGTTGWTNVSGSLAADTVTYDDTGLTTDQTYYYRVTAFNAEGDGDPSTVVNAAPTAATGGGNRMGGGGAIRRPATNRGRGRGVPGGGTGRGRPSTPPGQGGPPRGRGPGGGGPPGQTRPPSDGGPGPGGGTNPPPPPPPPTTDPPSVPPPLQLPPEVDVIEGDDEWLDDINPGG